MVIKLQEIICDLKKEMDDKSFSEVLREARDRLGLKQYRAAEHLGTTLNRLKNLEIGFFRVMPTALEIKNVCEFYLLPQDEMMKKAKEHVLKHSRNKKVNVNYG